MRRVDHDIGRIWGLKGGRDARKIGNLATPCLGVQALTSRRSHSSIGVETYISTKSSRPIISAAMRRRSRVGDTNAANVITPVEVNSLHTSGYAADILAAVALRKAQIGVYAAADVVAVEYAAQMTARGEVSFEGYGYGALSRA